MRRFASFALALLAAAPLAAQRTPVDSIRDDAHFSFYAKGPYRASVPRPDDVLGYGIGTWHTQYASQEKVLFAIADAAKDRVRVEEIGRSSEKRTMRIYIVSSPENIARLDQIRADLDKIADPRGVGAAELDAITARTPTVVWFSGSVHGDEVPGFEASMALLYHFAATEDPKTLALLKDAIVIINPSSNPDGHERFSVWSNSVAVGSPERAGIEQQRGQPWSISGRYNHYRFDMNRDLIATTQLEVRNIVAGMLRWHPMVTADLHGYTVQYYMAPASRPINANISGWPNKWNEAIGAGNARAFDEFGWLYYVRDQFDLYYPGYYDTWPALNGATGATYETDGGPSLLKRRDDGTLLSLRDGIAKHYTAAVATFETTASRARERVKDYLAFRQLAVSDGKTQPMKRVVFAPGNDPARAAELAAVLLRAGVEVHRLSQPLTSTRAHAYSDDATAAHTFPAGSFVVDLAQPQGRVAKALLEPDPALDPVFAKTQLDYFKRNINRGKNGGGEGYEFYDITAWALPVSFGVESWWTEDAAPMNGEKLSIPGAGAPRINGETLPVTVRGGIVDGANARSAYLFRNDRAGASRLAGQLLQEGYKLAIGNEPLQTGKIDWPRGTWVARVSRNDATLGARIDALAKAAGVEVTGVNTAFPETSQFGTGSGSTVSVLEPKIAVAADQGVGLGAYGSVWWSLEQRYGIRFTPVALSSLNGDMSAFNVIIIPDGNAGTLGKGAGLKAWVEKGGTLITMGGSTSWAAREDVGMTTARILTGDDAKDEKKKDEPKDEKPKADTKSDSKSEKPKAEAAPAALLGADSLLAVKSPSANPNAPQPVPGAHFDAVLDMTHWLTLGVEKQRTTVMFEGDAFLKLSKEGTNVAVFPTTGLFKRAGFTFPDNTERLLKGTALVVEEPVGRGHLVMFANDPMFRGWWRALDRLVLNAALLGPTF
ncbi:MAG TPA: M14 family zinc carboxypeptidase [Gemmatimonadaceae bacterium]